MGEAMAMSWSGNWKETLEPGWKLVDLDTWGWVDVDNVNRPGDVYEFLNYTHGRMFSYVLWFPGAHRKLNCYEKICDNCEDESACGYRVLEHAMKNRSDEE
jgi:hypothetical protein